MEAITKIGTKPSLSRLNIFETCFIDFKEKTKKKGKSIKYKKSPKSKKVNYLLTEKENNKKNSNISKLNSSPKESKSKNKTNSKNKNSSGHNSPIRGIKAIKERINKNSNISTEKRHSRDREMKKETNSKSKRIKEQNIVIKSKNKTINEKSVEKSNNSKTIDVAVPKRKNKRNNNRVILSPKRNEIRKMRITNSNKEISKNKSEPKMLLKKTIDSKKIKETISTNLDTISTEKKTKQKSTISPEKDTKLKNTISTEKGIKQKSTKSPEKSIKKKRKISPQKNAKQKSTISLEKNAKQKNIDSNNNNNNTEENKITFARIPILIRRQSRIYTGTTFNAKDVEKAIKLRRQQYNEYLKSLNKPKPKLILKQDTISESESEPEPEPKVYDSEKVRIIQRIFKGYHVKEIHQTLNRLRINSCLNELLCLISGKVYIHAKKRITFNILKTYYHEPFIDICEEVGFQDKIAIKLSDRYYNFKNLVEYEYYEL